MLLGSNSPFSLSYVSLTLSFHVHSPVHIIIYAMQHENMFMQRSFAMFKYKNALTQNQQKNAPKIT